LLFPQGNLILCANFRNRYFLFSIKCRSGDRRKNKRDFGYFSQSLNKKEKRSRFSKKGNSACMKNEA